MENVKVIIDTDPGTDDCAAITHFLKLTNVIAITTVFGNCNQNTASSNACRILEFLGMENIPVYKGAYNGLAMVTNWDDTGPHVVHGIDGLNDTDVIPTKVNKCPESDKCAPNAIIDLVTKYPGEIVLVAIGPLTNIAIATRLCPELPKLVKAFYVMGGCTVTGNITRWAEFNFHCDPLAAHVTLQHFCKTTLVHLTPWETCLENCLSFPKYKALYENVNTAAGTLLQCTGMRERVKERERKNNGGYVFADQFVPLTVLYPESVIASEKYDTAKVNHMVGDPKYGLTEYVRYSDTMDLKKTGLVVYTKYNMDYMEKLYVNAMK